MQASYPDPTESDFDTLTTAHEAFTILRPKDQSSPVIYASPHSGNNYPSDFVKNARLDPVMLRRSEDAFIDELYAYCTDNGSPLLKANFPRAYVDPNREPYELDPAMFDGRLPSYVNVNSARALAGLGTVAKVVTNGNNIYKGKLNFEEVHQRIENCYHPYHRALRQMIEQTRAQFGSCLLIDCHSMPSIGGPMDNDNGLNRTDIILGDRFGSSCANWITDLVQETLEKSGFVVLRNRPYAGGFTTAHYGIPKKRVHALQIELNRELYMDEETITRLGAFDTIRQNLQPLIRDLAKISATDL